MTSTERDRSHRDTGIQAWHFYILLSLAGATWAVVVSRHTHPAALLLLSGAIVAVGLVGAALHNSLTAFFGAASAREAAPLMGRSREAIEKEKALVLRSIKELEFDRAMGKVSDADFVEIGGHLRARALVLMGDLDQADAAAPVARRRDRAGATAPEPEPEPPNDDRRERVCASCGADLDPDARFCKLCGVKVA